jgi:hypothetical protein
MSKQNLISYTMFGLPYSELTTMAKLHVDRMLKEKQR